jgi:hypothetical protein
MDLSLPNNSSHRGEVEMTHDELLAKVELRGAWKDERPNQVFVWVKDWNAEQNTNALRAVVELHRENKGYCVRCSFNDSEYKYPCPTIQAIEKELS